ncbi:hypothetical protein CHS0354_002265 [Potamilus streckersoni]|uniref:SEA domain-containing protein n=1 Tax=Potamilus streckersoni TaxID=2493646 RepID=A0AAE0VPZ1_9BIVA|nr:hypothetical protein CHS0354_002265 [Potamilus streckersoni]
MVSLGTSILLMVFVQAGIALTSTTTSQDSPAVNATTTIQVTKQADTATQGNTTSQPTTISQDITTSQDATTTQTTSTLQTTTTSQGITIPQTTTTSQNTTASQTTATSLRTTTPQTTITSQSTTPQITTTSQTTTTSPGITIPQTTTSSPTAKASQTTTTSQSITTRQTTTRSQATTTSQRTTNPQINTTSERTTTPQPTKTSQGTTSTRSPFAMPSKESVSNEPDPVNYYLRLHLDLKVYLDFKDIYEDRSSPEFQSLATNFSVSLIQHFQYIKGFKSIDILQFSPGSVVVDYSVNVYATVDILAVTNQIENEVVDSLKEVAGAHVDIDYTRTSMKIRLESLRKRDKCSLASENLCPFGYYCKLAGTATLLCIDRCNVSVCENNGLCYIGHLSQDIQCKCPISDGAVFTGARCETKQVVMTIQERNLYLIIGGSILGAVIFSFVLTVCIINRKRRILKKKLSSINLRMKQDELHPTGIKYIRDEHDIYADGKETSINRQRQNIFDTTDNPFEGRIDQNVDDGYQRAVENLRGDDGYLRTAEGTRRKDDSEYDYIK